VSNKRFKGFLGFMGNLRAVKSLSFGLAFAMAYASSACFAADILWEGRYRIEGNYIKNYTLSKTAGIEDSYLIHHLILEPKIIAMDGINIKSRFDIFNGPLGNDQHGQVFGNYNGATGNPQTGAGSGASPPAVFTTAENNETVQVSELYFEWINEFGALTAGRVPFNFGLGMKYNVGAGNFDHYLSNKDMVAYKLVLGNISIMPAYGKVREGALLNEDDGNDYLIVADYTNPDSQLSMGVMFDQRVAPYDQNYPAQGNDFPSNYFNYSTTRFAYNAANIPGGFSAYNLNFYVKKKSDNFNFGIELGFTNGSTGLSVTDSSTTNNVNVNLSGFGGAAELGYRTGNIKLNLHAGLASGDDPNTANVESYSFSPNYTVAMMMFHYPVGQYDALRSTIYGSHPSYNAGTNLALANTAGLDTEMISNAIYFAPNVTWSLGDRYDVLATFCYGTTMQSPVSSTNTPAGQNGNIGNQLGFETDLGFSYHLNSRFTWDTTLGFFFPGNAFNGPYGYSNDMAYGATTKAAITF
jgi:hypothetical protein